MDGQRESTVVIWIMGKDGGDRLRGTGEPISKIPHSTFCVMQIQIQTHSLSKTGTKVVIALNGETNGYRSLIAVDGNRRSTNQRTLRVAGTITLKSGWKTSVNIFTRDNNWIAKSSSGFSCHLLKTFNGCSGKQASQVSSPIFPFVKDQMNTTINWTTRVFDTNVRTLPAGDFVSQLATPTAEFADAVMPGASYLFACSPLVITLAIQIH